MIFKNSMDGSLIRVYKVEDDMYLYEVLLGSAPRPSYIVMPKGALGVNKHSLLSTWKPVRLYKTVLKELL